VLKAYGGGAVPALFAKLVGAFCLPFLIHTTG
jgi:hypothetical protein